MSEPESHSPVESGQDDLLLPQTPPRAGDRVSPSRNGSTMRGVCHVSEGTLKRATVSEAKAGSATFECPVHGALAVTLAWADVRCACGKKAKAVGRNGTPLTATQIRRLQRGAS